MEIEHGTVRVLFDDFLKPPEQAGKLSPAEVARIPKTPRGIGLVCYQAADVIEKGGAKFTPPRDVTPQSLRDAGRRAEEIDTVIVDLEVVLGILKQGNLLFDAGAWEQIRKVNDQVKVQMKHDPEIASMFKPVLDFFAKGPRQPKEG